MVVVVVVVDVEVVVVADVVVVGRELLVVVGSLAVLVDTVSEGLHAPIVKTKAVAIR